MVAIIVISILVAFWLITIKYKKGVNFLWKIIDFYRYRPYI